MRIKSKRVTTIVMSGLLAFVSVFSLLDCRVNASDGVEINDTNFPDDNFREKIVRPFDLDGDNWLSDSEIDKVTKITIDRHSAIDSHSVVVESMEGIDYFSNLEELQTDVKMDTLDVSVFPKLKFLGCGDCDLKKIILNESITAISCGYNNNLKTIDVSKCKNLKILYIAYTGIETLDLSNNQKLEELYIDDTKIKNIDLKSNKSLKRFWCPECNLTALDVSTCPELTHLSCWGNKITKLDLTNNKKLELLYCGQNNITELNLDNNNNLSILDCVENKITKLDLRNTKIHYKEYKNDGGYVLCDSGVKVLLPGDSEEKKQEDDSEKKKESPKYSNEWVDGKWYDADGSQTYKGTMQWKSNATGWWIEDSTGWYPTNNWQKIDGVWYFFKPDGYMAANEYYNGYWFNKDGSWDEQYFLSWKQNSTGWWVEDKSGWWPASSWLKIDGYWYYFDASGYMVTNQYVDGWWISSDGVCY